MNKTEITIKENKRYFNSTITIATICVGPESFTTFVIADTQKQAQQLLSEQAKKLESFIIHENEQFKSWMERCVANGTKNT